MNVECIFVFRLVGVILGTNRLTLFRHARETHDGFRQENDERRQQKQQREQRTVVVCDAVFFCYYVFVFLGDGERPFMLFVALFVFGLVANQATLGNECAVLLRLLNAVVAQHFHFLFTLLARQFLFAVEFLVLLFHCLVGVQFHLFERIAQIGRAHV